MTVKKYKKKSNYVYLIYKDKDIVGVYSSVKHICSTSTSKSHNFKENETLVVLSDEQMTKVIDNILKNYTFVESLDYDDPCLKKDTWLSNTFSMESHKIIGGSDNQGGFFM